MARQPTLAFIGLGSMGLGMALSAVRAGFPVRGFDISDGPSAILKNSGGSVGQSPADAARGADIVVVVVVNADQTENVLFGDGGAVEALGPGAVIISCATIPPVQARSFAKRVEERGLLYLDGPISGGSQKANTGELTFMASGSREAFAAARPALDAMAGTVYELGEQPGVGSSFKIINQLLAGVHIAAACEAITFAKRLDLDISRVFEVITKSAGNSWMFENRIPHVLAGDYTPHSAVSIFTKDLGIVSDIGRSEKFPLPIAAAALQLFVMTEAVGMARDDDSSIARLLAHITGVSLPGKTGTSQDG
jgi:L-threonate 2-dehydrogenase